MIKKNINPASPVPLYHQIAEAIREEIEAGELSRGDVLEPLREAAHTWGVNLHTVRHAYTALARDGLVELRGARGTRVTGGPALKRPDRTAAIARFVDRILQEAREHHDLNLRGLVREISRRSERLRNRHPIVYVVECSAWQCEAHAREIEARFVVDAREWSLEREDEPPPGAVIATYFHYNDIRRLWPHRLREVRFVTIVPDPGLVDRLPGDVQSVLLCEHDEETAENVAADLSVLLAPRGYRIKPVVSADVENVITGSNEASIVEDSIVLVAPRIWASLSEAMQSNRRVFTADYVIDEEELNALGSDQGWAARAPIKFSSTT